MNRINYLSINLFPLTNKDRECVLYLTCFKTFTFHWLTTDKAKLKNTACYKIHTHSTKWIEAQAPWEKKQQQKCVGQKSGDEGGEK